MSETFNCKIRSGGKVSILTVPIDIVHKAQLVNGMKVKVIIEPLIVEGEQQTGL